MFGLAGSLGAILVGDAAGVEGAVASAPPDTAGKSSRKAVEVKIVMSFMSQITASHSHNLEFKGPVVGFLNGPVLGFVPFLVFAKYSMLARIVVSIGL